MINSRVSGVVAAPVGVVWREIRDFSNLRYFAAAASVDIDRSDPGSVGVVRTIGLHGGGGGREQLLGLSDHHHRLEYAFIDDPAQPFASYVAQVSLTPITMSGHTLVTWQASYTVTAEDVGAVQEFIETHIMTACIEGLQKVCAD